MLQQIISAKGLPKDVITGYKFLRVKNTLMIDCKIIQYFNNFLKSFAIPTGGAGHSIQHYQASYCIRS